MYDEDGDSAIFKLKVNIDLGVMATLKKVFFFKSKDMNFFELYQHA